MANSADSELAATPGADWSGSAPFAQTCLSQYIELFTVKQKLHYFRDILRMV